MEISYNQEQNALSIREELNGFRETKQHCDFVIKVGTEEIHVHQNVLCANSKYFKAMLSHDTAEKQTGRVELKDMNANCVQICADFMYCQFVFVEDENREDLLRTADFLQLHHFRDSIAEYYKENLDENTFYATKKLATTYHCTDLDEKCDTFATENFEAIAQLEEYKNLTQEYVAFLLESTLNKTSATNKVKALMNWVRHDVTIRESLLPAMLAKLQLSKVSVQYQRYLLHEELLTTESLNCIKLLCDSLLPVPTTVSIHTSEKQSDSIVVFDDTSRSLHNYCPDDDSWTEMCELHDGFKLDQFTAVSLKSEIFVIMKTRTVYKLSQFDGQYEWVQMAYTLRDHGVYPPAVSDDNFIYVVGCWLGSQYSQIIEKFDPTLNHWTKLTDRNVERKSSTPVILDGSIYCIGGQEIIQCDSGQTEKIYFKTVEVFDIGSKEWNIAAPLLHARCHCAGIAYSGKIYIMGGWCGKGVLNAECYDQVSNAWISLTPMLQYRQAPQVVLIGDEIFAVGGYRNFPSTMEKYSIKENKWSLAKIPEDRELKILWCVGILHNQKNENMRMRSIR